MHAMACQLQISATPVRFACCMFVVLLLFK
jgi:hypothetical protein